MSRARALPRIDLPAEWDLERDLLILYGAQLDGLARLLRGRGQRRLLLYSSEPSRACTDAGWIGTPIELVEAIQTLPGADPERVAIAPVPPARIPDAFAPVLRQAAADALASRVVHRTSMERTGPVLVEQALENLPSIASHPSVEVLRGAFPALPCLIVSPGPSLARNVQRLAAVGPRALILSSTHALPVLTAAGVRAHFAVATDALPLDWQYGEHDFRAQAGLVLAATVHPDLFGLPARHLFTCATSRGVDAWIHAGLPGDACLPSGGSVAGTQLSLALAMGCDPVIFVGQDLAFSGGRYYASDALDGESEVRPSPDGKSFVLERRMRHPGGLAGLADAQGVLVNHPERLLEVPGWHGGSVPTSESFYHFRAWLGARARSVDDGRTIYNCTEGGAWIDGMRHEPLGAVLERVLREPCPIEAQLDSRASRWDAEHARTVLAERLEREQASLDAAGALALRCDRLARRALRDADRLAELDRSEKKLSLALGGLEFLSLAAQAELRAATERAATARSLAANLAAAHGLFTVVRRASQAVRGSVIRARERLSAA